VRVLDQVTQDDFSVFVKEAEPRLTRALSAAYGIQVGRDATADSIAYAWEHWERIQYMANPTGYLYRVGQTSARKYMRSDPLFPAVDRVELPHIEPGLPAALTSLTESQRTAVMLLYGLEWSEREVAELLDVDRSTVRSHKDRGIDKLRKALEVGNDG